MNDLPVFARPRGWSVPALLCGFALIGACVLVPEWEENQLLAHQGRQIAQDLAHVDSQIQANEDFIARLGTDAELAERLAQRQMKMIRQGTGVLDLGEGQPQTDAQRMSPFLLAALPPPQPIEPYRSPAPLLTTLFGHAGLRIYLLGAAILLIATAMLLDAGKPSARKPSRAPAAA